MPTPPLGGPWDTARDTLAQWVAQATWLHDLGLPMPPTRAVFQADVVESPRTPLFVVIRWGDVTRRVGAAWSQNVDFWVYDDLGDYTRASKVAKAICDNSGKIFEPIKTNSGWLSQLHTSGDGLGIGGDLADEGFDKLVIPVRALAVGRGV